MLYLINILIVLTFLLTSIGMLITSIKEGYILPSIILALVTIIIALLSFMLLCF